MMSSSYEGYYVGLKHSQYNIDYLQLRLSYDVVVDLMLWQLLLLRTWDCGIDLFCTRV